MATIQWLTGVSGDWSQGSDWAGGVAPGAGDDAVIDASGSYTVTISTAISANSLTLNDSQTVVTETATGSLTLSGALVEQPGVVEDPGARVQIDFNGTTTTLTVDLTSGGPLTYTLAGDYSADSFNVTVVGTDSNTTVVPASIVANGDFATGDFTDWTLVTTANGSLGPPGSGLPAVTSFNVTGSGAQNAATFQVGEVSFNGTQQGGGIEQTVTLTGGSISFSAAIAALGASVNNVEGGVFSVLLDGVTEDTVDIGPIGADAVIRSTLAFTASESAGPHTLEILITRPYLNGSPGETPEEFVTNIAITPTGTIYTGSYLSGIVLSNPATQNPATVTASGYVTNQTTAHNGDAVYGTNAAAWNFTNLGTIKATGATATGVHLKAGGSVTNRGVIEQSGTASFAIDIEGSAGTIVNYGIVQNIGTNAAIRLGAGGMITNGASGSSAALIESVAAGNAINISNAPGTVVNFGTVEITGTGNAVYLNSGGVTNFATIESVAGNGIEIGSSTAGSTGTVDNLASILSTGTFNDAVLLEAGGSVTNGAAGSTTALIASSHTGISFKNAAGTLVNFGAVESTTTGTSGDAIYLGAGGVVTNYGVISGAGSASLSGTVTARPAVVDAHNVAGHGPELRHDHQSRQREQRGQSARGRHGRQRRQRFDRGDDNRLGDRHLHGRDTRRSDRGGVGLRQ